MKFSHKGHKVHKELWGLGHSPRYFVLFVFYVANNHFSALSSCSQQQHLPPQDLHEPPHSHGTPFFTARQAASVARVKTTDTTMIDS